MRMRNFILMTIPILVAPLRAGDLPLAIQAKFVRILAATMQSAGHVYCKDPDMIAALKSMGVMEDDNSKVAWAATEGDVAKFKNEGKLVICGKLEWLAKGGAVAVVEENGKPQIYLHMNNIAASGVHVSDSVLMIAKRM